MRNKNALWRPIVTLVVGLAIVIFGLTQLFASTADCGGQTMHAGDICREYSNSDSTTGTDRSVDEQLHKDHQQGGIAAGIGGIAILAGVFSLVQRQRRLKATVGV